MSGPRWSASRRGPGVLEVSLDFQKARDCYWFLITSDVHIDSPRCDRKMFKRHLEELKDRGGGLIDNGDLFDVMQGKFDKRSHKKSMAKSVAHRIIESEIEGYGYLDAVVDEAEEFLSPYAQNVLVLGAGNHETSVTERKEVRLTDALANRLTSVGNRKVFSQGYDGFILFRCKRGKSSKTIVMYRHHGAGKGAEMSFGVLDTKRMAARLPDANIIVSGHNHKEYCLPLARDRITSHGAYYRDEQWHLRIPGYKDGWGQPGTSTWEKQKNLGPSTHAAYWLKIYRKPTDTSVTRMMYGYKLERADV